ncbi:uncharacterized protein LOC127530951 [Acanthochromis polyacanthus]|uniref:uncharacterized protein LOC127530951 n=1 Tax=Acanthochromis polyacanthus TaxID=80966 RepID=UPI002234D043|nr:uncharacterized protein LOC127530951 [Acanthochromis polyacanthus]
MSPKRNKKKVESDDGGAAGSDSDAANVGPKEGVEELSALVKMLIENQNARDKKIEEELSKQEQCWRFMQEQFQKLQQQQKQSESYEQNVHGRNIAVQPLIDDGEEAKDEGPDPGGYGGHGYRSHWEAKLPVLTANDDIEHFLITFERMAQVCRWPEEEWSVRLVPLLTGKARSAFVQMDIRYSDDYEKVKDAILAKYEITDETYRRRFRSLKIEPDETPWELYVRLKDLLHRWLHPEKAKKSDMLEKLILEQFLRMVSPELEVWIRERAPRDAAEAARLAEAFLSARKRTRVGDFGQEPRFTKQSKSFGGDRRGLGPGGYVDEPSPQVEPGPAKKCSNFKMRGQDLRCHNCNGLGHIQRFCPAQKVKPSLLCAVPRPVVSPSVEVKGCTTPVLVNGQKVEALLDSGCFQSVVLSSLVSGERWSRDKTPLTCIHGDEHLYPTAEVYLTVGGQTYLLNVALAENLPYDAILGNDVPTLVDLMSQSTDWDQWLPYLLFAYREVPQSSTGFSPFELLYGRQVRGPLDLLKDYWERTENEGDNIIAYVLKMRERLEAMTALAQDNLKEAQQYQKVWFDQKAKERVFSPGQKFKAMPFGLQGAPATFQRLMDYVLRDVTDFAAAYLDDVIVYSSCWEEHLYHLQEVLKRIRAAGLTINPRKCFVAHREVQYLGFTIGFGKIKPRVEKMDAIRSFPVPTTKRQVRLAKRVPREPDAQKTVPG